MFIHPFDVPAIIWFPNAVNIVTHVDCFASCTACFAATVGSISSSRGRSGVDGRIRLIGFADDTSTKTGWSSKRDATNNKLIRISMNMYINEKLT